MGILFVLAVTILYGLTYLGIQQLLRHNADKPQISLVSEAAAALTRGDLATSVLPSPTIDLRESLEPFVIVYDTAGKPTAGSGLLDGELPTPPAGVFTYASEHGEDRVTWQPKSDVRIATVIKPFSGPASGFVLAGRSLAEVERKTDILLVIIAGAYTATMLTAFVPMYLLLRPRKNRLLTRFLV